MLLRFTFSWFFIALCSCQLGAAVLPYAYQLSPQAPPKANSDAKLWLEKLNGLVRGGVRSSRQFKKTDDLLVRYYITHYTKKKRSASPSDSDLKTLIDSLTHYAGKNGSSHYLAPYLLELVAKEAQKKSRREQAIALLLRESPRSCPAKKRWQKVLRNGNYLRRHRVFLNQRIADLGQIKNKSDLRRLLHHSLLEKDRFGSMFASAIDQLKNQRIDFGLGKKSSKGKGLSLAVLETWIEGGRCRKAFEHFERILHTKSSLGQKKATNIAIRVGECYRSYSKKTLRRWRSIGKVSTKRKWADLIAYVRIKEGRILWSRDEYKDAIKILQSVRSDRKLSRFYPDSLYWLAKSYDSLGESAKVIHYSIEFLDKYSSHDLNLLVLEQLLMTYVRIEDWLQVEKIAQRLVYLEDDLAVTQRDIATLGMGLFWKGLAQYKVGQKKAAFAAWRRLAGEGFSTYYGALGHYFLERHTKNVIWPKAKQKQMPSFHRLTRVFSGIDQQIIRRVQLFSRIGYDSAARCEVSELDAQESDHKRFVKSLIMHVTGSWLAAIKSYHEISRSYRSYLPYGAERIVYPKKYENFVRDYAPKLGLDEDLVLGLIRQESVFDPRARSRVGARGLMQLMKGTALQEARSARKSYLSTKERRRMARQIRRRPSTLYQPDTNIALGVHYLNRQRERFQSVALALAAYNAGPSVVNRWLKDQSNVRTLYFIEKIPYKETKNYVKLIFRNYFYYKKWYPSPADPPKLMDELFRDYFG